MDIIRKYYEPDLNKLMQIWYDGNIQAHDFIDVSYWDRNYGYVSRLLPRTEVYVYEANGTVAGFVGVNEGYIEGLFVDETYRGFGIGTKLLNYVIEQYDFITLHVFENNKKAVAFYEKMGLRRRQTEINEDLGEVEYLMYYRTPKEDEDE